MGSSYEREQLNLGGVVTPTQLFCLLYRLLQGWKYEVDFYSTAAVPSLTGVFGRLTWSNRPKDKSASVRQLTYDLTLEIWHRCCVDAHVIELSTESPGCFDGILLDELQRVRDELKIDVDIQSIDTYDDEQGCKRLLAKEAESSYCSMLSDGTDVMSVGAVAQLLKSKPGQLRKDLKELLTSYGYGKQVRRLQVKGRDTFICMREISNEKLQHSKQLTKKRTPLARGSRATVAAGKCKGKVDSPGF